MRDDWVQRAQAWDASQAEKVLASAENHAQEVVKGGYRYLAKVVKDANEVAHSEEIADVTSPLRRLVALNGKGGTSHAVIQGIKTITGEKHKIEAGVSVKKLIIEGMGD